MIAFHRCAWLSVLLMGASACFQATHGQPPSTSPLPGGSVVATATPQNLPLLPLANRRAIRERLVAVGFEIETIEDKMFELTDKYHDSLVTSRDRWHSELDRVQTEIRMADKAMAEAETKSAEMNKRMASLMEASKKQLAEDAALENLKRKLETLHTKRGRITADGVRGEIKPRSLPALMDSVTGEILDTEMEIAQRIESITSSYEGGQAKQIERQLQELEVDVQVKKRAKAVLEERFEKLQGLSADITSYARLERQVDALQILHRKLAELNAQQEIELLRSTDPNKQPVALAGAK
jgi:DNA repair exonuclease SbcCD ATPase subunit